MHSRSVGTTGSEGNNLRETEEEPPEKPARLEDEEEKVYVAVGKELKESKSTLLWALQNTCREKKLVLLHVHRPAQRIHMMGSWFPASQLREQHVNTYRQSEREKVNRSLNEFLHICSLAKVQAEKLVIEVDDVGKGLVDVIAQHGITKLVMGAAAGKHYSRKMKVLKSKTAITVQVQADLSCKIWFVCKGNLICIRDAGLEELGLVQSPTASTISFVSRSEQRSARSLPQHQGESLNLLTNHAQGLLRHRSKAHSSALDGEEIIAALPQEGPLKMSILQSRLKPEQSNVDIWKGISRSSQCSVPSSCSASVEVLSNVSSLSVTNKEESEEGSVGLPMVHQSEDDQFSAPHHELEDLEEDDKIYEKPQQALIELENLKREVYEESLRRQKAERDIVKALQKAKASELLYMKEMKQRKDIEETLAKAKLEMEELKNHRDEICEELQRAHEQKLLLELQIADSDRIVKEFEEKLSALQRDYKELQLERDNVVREAEELRREKEEFPKNTHGPIKFSDFSYLELEEATHNFDDSLKIGEGRYGSVYKGFLRHTTVAIKMMNSQSMQGQSEFHQEVDVLSRVRHPNLVTLIGGCSEAWALIYEFLPNGSLEECLVCKNDTPPLTWQVRTRIASEICSALIFLHSNKPHSVVYGDLKPSNVLLDANFVSKLDDFGTCRFLVQFTTNTLYRRTHPKGTLLYMDPEFIATGELTPHSDVYSFGIIILRLLTGKPAFGIAKEVQEALERGNLYGILDGSAGEWPLVLAKELAHLGLRCCELYRRRRPDLSEVWRVLEPVVKAVSWSRSSMSFGSTPEDNSHIPSYFLCPIFQEIMMDPHIAADGFTYEAVALKGWLDSGHDTSPMTNLKLPHSELIPNRALRSAIQDWQQQQQPP